MEINQTIFNEIMEKALKTFKETPSRSAWDVADDCCRPHLEFFGRDINAYEELVFQVTMNVVNANRE
jgi:hypothetical protein